MKNIIKQSIILIFLAVLIVSFLGCEKKGDTKINTKKQEGNQQIVKSETILKFEKFLEENGEKIELEKIDTTNWKTYTDKERGFSFEYPKNWHATTIDSSKDIKLMYSKESQKLYKEYYYPDNPAHIKGQTEPFDFLCIIDEKYQQEREKNKEELQLKGEYNSYCNIIFSEYITTYKGNKKSSGELWVEHYLSTLESVDKRASYLQVQNMYVFINKIYTGGSFIGLNNFKISFSSFDQITKQQVTSEEIKTLFQSFKYVK